jgi:hypothetical protein
MSSLVKAVVRFVRRRVVWIWDLVPCPRNAPARSDPPCRGPEILVNEVAVQVHRFGEVGT